MNSKLNKELVRNYILGEVVSATGLSLLQLKQKYSEDRLFLEALKHVTTTKKAICEALKIPVEGACRYKRSFEDAGLLVQSDDDVICPFTKFPARLLTSNPDEFDRLRKLNKNQLTFF